MEFGSIIISETVNSENPQVINSNISVINLMREEKIDDDLIQDALMSYYLDYYTSIPKVILLNLFIIPIGTRN
jgi:hypothetical protein